MYYNSNKLKLVDKKLAKIFRNSLDATNYRFVFNSLIGPMANIDNWIDEINILKMLERVSADDKELVEVLLLGYSKRFNIIRRLLGKGTDFLLETGAFKLKGEMLSGLGYVIIPVNDFYLIVSLPGSYKMANTKFSDIYIGQDSMRLQQMLKNMKFRNVLDLCAGSGVQGLHYLSKADSVVAVELNDNAYIAAMLNAYINGAVHNYKIYKGDLYNALPEEKQMFDCIISNPPYVPIPLDVDVAMCGDGGPDGMKYAKQIIDGYEHYLAVNGYAYMVLECIGDEEEPYILNYYRKKLKKGILNVSIINKSSLIFQAHASALLASITEKELYSLHLKKWKELFENQEATAIYPVTIEYINVDCELKENIIHNYQNISVITRFIISNDVKWELKSKAYYDISKKDKRLASIRRDIFENILQNKGGSVADLVTIDDNVNINELYEYLNTFIVLESNGILKKM